MVRRNADDPWAAKAVHTGAMDTLAAHPHEVAQAFNTTHLPGPADAGRSAAVHADVAGVGDGWDPVVAGDADDAGRHWFLLAWNRHAASAQYAGPWRTGSHDRRSTMDVDCERLGVGALRI